MDRKKQILSKVLFSIALICLLFMIGIQVHQYFYFGKLPEKMAQSELTIINQLGYENSLPKWVWGGDNQYYLQYAAVIGQEAEDASPPLTISFGENESKGISHTETKKIRKIHTNIVLVTIDPWKKEVVQVDDNVHQDELRDGLNAHISFDRQYQGYVLEDGMVITEDFQKGRLPWSVYYIFDHSGNPGFQQRSRNLMYIKGMGVFHKPMVYAWSLGSGGMDQWMMQQRSEKRIIPVPMGTLYGNGMQRELFFSRAKMNYGFQYQDMQDLWQISIDGTVPEKIGDHIYSPVFSHDEDSIAFLRKEGEDLWSLWIKEKQKEERKLIEFSYHSINKEVPPIGFGKEKDKGFKIYYVQDNERENRDLMRIDSETKKQERLMEQQPIVGPIITSSHADLGKSQNLLIFTDNQKERKAFIIDGEERIGESIYDLLVKVPVDR